MTFADKVRAIVHASRLDPEQGAEDDRRGSKKMVVYDDMLEDKIVLYDKGIDYYEPRWRSSNRPPSGSSIRTGDVLLPRIQYVQPLRRQAEHFVQCVRTMHDAEDRPAERARGGVHTWRLQKPRCVRTGFSYQSPAE